MGGCSIRKKAVPTNFSIVLRVDRPRFARLPRFDPGFLARIDRWRLPTSGARDRPTLPNVVSRQRRNQRTTIHEPLAAQHQHGSEQQGEGGRGDLRGHLLHSLGRANCCKHQARVHRRDTQSDDPGFPPSIHAYPPFSRILDTERRDGLAVPAGNKWQSAVLVRGQANISLTSLEETT